MKFRIRAFGLFLTALSQIPVAVAELTFLPDPVSSTASSSFAGDIPGWGPQRLYDANPSATDLDTNFDAGNTSQYAGDGQGPHVLVFDYGADITFSGVAYSQRLGGDPVADKAQNIDVWVSTTDPGAAGVGLPDVLGGPAANTGQLNTDSGVSTFLNYDLGLELTGRYVIFRINDAGPGSGNPGGSELQLTVDADPADPKIAAPATYGFGRVPASSESVTGQFDISNDGATQNLVISDVTVEGQDETSFNIVSSPTSLAPGTTGSIVVNFTPGATPGPVEATIIIASNDSNIANTNVSLTATLSSPLPDDLALLADPLTVTASSFFDASFAPEFLFDANPTLDDIENPAFDPLSQYAGTGEGPHVLVFDYGESIDFNGMVYAQRLGGIVDADKVPSVEIWASDTDPGPAAIDLAILSDPVGATTDLITTDTSSLLRYYSLSSDLSGRYVVMRLAQGNFNPGGSELQFTMSGTSAPLQISSITYPGGTSATITWNSRSGKTYRVERSANLQAPWEELTNNTPSGGETTSFSDNTLALDTTRMFYRVIEN